MSNWTSPIVTATTQAAPAISSTSGYGHYNVSKSVTQLLRPTVSLEARPIVIPILSSMFGFPVLALVVICALRYRAKRARLRSHLKRARKSPSTPFRRAIYRGKHNHRRPSNNTQFNNTRLKVLREPPTLTELSVIGFRGQSSTSEESAVLDCRGIGCTDIDGDASQDQASQDYSSSNSETPSPSLKNGGVKMAFQTTPLDILSGTAGLEFSYTVVEHC